MEYSLEDLIDVKLLQNLLDKLNVVYSFPSAIVDNDGKILTAVAWQDICTKFHRTHPLCEIECIKSDQYILSHLHEADPAVRYQCPHGLIDNAAPIVIDGKHMGNFFIGQFFLDEPDLEFFKKQAVKYGFDETEYLEAVKKVPIWTQEKLVQYIDFIKGFIEIIAGIGLNHLREIETNQAVKKSEERNRAIVQSTSDWIWELDAEGRYSFCSDRVGKILGYTVDEIIGKSPLYLMPPDEGERIVALFRTLYDTKDPIVDFESLNLHKDGRSVYLLTNAFPIYDETGAIKGYRGAHKDITERKQSMMSLMESEELFKSMIFNSSDLIILTDEKGIIKYISHQVSSVLGHPEEDFIGRVMPDILHPDDRARFRQVMEQVARKSQELREFEYRIIDSSGGVRWVSHSSKVIKVGNQVLDIQNTIRNITERKMAEEKLEETHNLLFKLSEQVPGVIYQYRLYPDGRSCFPYSSTGMQGIYEVSSEEVHEDATPVFGRLHPDDLERVSESIFESARTLEHFYCEFRVILPKQGLRWRYCDAVPERLEDGSTLWHGIISDITERKQTEIALNKSLIELQRFNDLMVGREIRMIDLKREVNALLKKVGMEEKYVVYSKTT